MFWRKTWLLGTYLGVINEYTENFRFDLDPTLLRKLITGALWESLEPPIYRLYKFMKIYRLYLLLLAQIILCCTSHNI